MARHQYPPASELPWGVLVALLAVTMGLHVLGGVIDWLARPPARSPVPPPIATPAPAIAMVPQVAVARTEPRRETRPVTPEWLPHVDSVMRLQGWLAFQKGGGAMPSDVQQRMTQALDFAQRVQRGQALTQTQETALLAQGMKVERSGNDVTVRFTATALPPSPSKVMRPPQANESPWDKFRRRNEALCGKMTCP